MTFRYATGLDWINDLLEIAVGFGFIKRLSTVTYALVNLKQEYKIDEETGEILKDEKTGEPVLNILLDEEGKPSAYAKLKSNYMKEFFRLCNELSLSPQSRAKLANINVGVEKEQQDPLLRIIQGGGG